MIKWKFWEVETKAESIIDDLRSMSKQLDMRLRKLECEHRLTNISKEDRGSMYPHYAYESCNSCNKILKLLSKEEFIRSRLEFYKKEIKALKETT